MPNLRITVLSFVLTKKTGIVMLASALENIHTIKIQNTSELSIPMSLTAMLKNVEDGFPKMIGSTPVEN